MADPTTTAQMTQADSAGNSTSAQAERDDAAAVDKQYSQQKRGPLGPLYQFKYTPTSLLYPRDLGKLGKGHSVQFDIKNIKPSEAIGKAYAQVSSAVENAYESYNDPNTSTTDKAKEVTKTVAAAGVTFFKDVNKDEAVKWGNNVKQAATEFMQDSFTNDLTTIRLHMPDSLSFNYNAQYDKLSLADALSAVPLVGFIPKQAMSILNNNAARFVGKKLGYTFNPQQQMLFEGIDFREFDLQFVFTPTSEKEAETVRQIIKKFRFAAAPSRNIATAGFFFTPPSVFFISFFFEGEINKFITPIRPSVLQSVSVDFAPSGWSAMRDGSPMQTSLTLSFKEIELIDRDSISQEWDGE